MQQRKIVVVGAGIVGAAAALHLVRAGHQVVLLDRKDGSAASLGNGGILAASAVIPVPVPGLIRQSPKLLFDKDAPLFLRWRYLPRMMPWLVRYLRHANWESVVRTATALTPLLHDSLGAHQDLAADSEAAKWIKPCTYNYMFASRKDYEKESAFWDLRRRLGFTWDEFTGDEFQGAEVARLAPLLVGHEFAIGLHGHGIITSPADYLADLIKAYQAKGGQVQKGEVDAISHSNGAVDGVRVGGAHIPAARVIIATGAWSGKLARQCGVKVPLESERGYHIELWNPNQMPHEPMMIAAGKFVITPMQGRIRLAGVVEFGGLDAPPSSAPFNMLMGYVRRYMPSLKWEEETRWMGHRPALTDSLPIISAVPNLRGVYMGFGHQHIGLTAGAKTGQLLAMLATDKVPNLDMSPYDIRRF